MTEKDKKIMKITTEDCVATLIFGLQRKALIQLKCKGWPINVGDKAGFPLKKSERNVKNVCTTHEH